MSQAWDVVVVGAGAAGLTAARHAREAGASVLVVNKGLAGRTGATITTGGGVSVSGRTVQALGLPGDPDDTDEDFFRDTATAGGFLGDQRLIEAMVAGVGEEVRRLMADGTRVLPVKRAPGHSSGRGVRISGPDMQRAVTQGAVKAGVLFREDVQLAGLLQDGNGEVVGLAGLDRRSGETEVIRAKAVILATGGATSNWSLRTAPEELTGDGHAAALDAGATLVEMEMTQFLPCCLVAPELWRGLQFPWILGPQSGIRAWLLNRYGERFMARWDPERMELATRDVVAAASATEVAEGRGSPHGGVYLSWAHLPADILENVWRIVPTISAEWRWEGFDMTPLVERIRAGRAIEVAPAAHFSIGGIRIDTEGATGVPGLFACGEAAGGLHGGNRLSGNAGAQILVQGRMAGRAAARAALRNSGGPPRNLDRLRARIDAPMRGRGGVAPLEVKRRLAALVEAALSPVRSGAALEQGLADLADLRSSLDDLACRTPERRWNRDWSDALECRSSVAVLEATLLSALRRCHSLGAHRRRDGPAGPTVLAHGFVRCEGESLVHHADPVAFPVLAPPAKAA